MINAILIDHADSVATVLVPVEAGERVEFVSGGAAIGVDAVQLIPQYHKIAVREVAPGENVIKYGEIIGRARRPIRIGEHVHTDNLSSDGR